MHLPSGDAWDVFGDSYISTSYNGQRINENQVAAGPSYIFLLLYICKMFAYKSLQMPESTVFLNNSQKQYLSPATVTSRRQSKRKNVGWLNVIWIKPFFLTPCFGINARFKYENQQNSLFTLY